MAFVLIFFLNLFIISCKGDLKKQNQINETVSASPNETRNTIKNIIRVNSKTQNHGLTLGSGANHLFSFDEQPRSFGSCINSEVNIKTPSTHLEANLFLKKISQDEKNYEKNVSKITRKLAAQASFGYFSSDINSFVKTLTNLVNESNIQKSGIEITFEAKRTFSRVAVNNISINNSVMTHVNRNPWNFYSACGTGAVVSVAKEVHFVAKALCEKLYSTNLHESLNEMERSLNIRVGAKDVYEISGSFEMASNLSTVLNSLSKHGIKECRWEVEAVGLPTLNSDANLIDTEDLIKTAQKGLNLVMQANYDSANVTDMEILPYYNMPPLIEHDQFFQKFNFEVKDSEKDLNRLQDRINKQFQFLTPVARTVGLDLKNTYVSNSVKSVQQSIELFNNIRLNPVANRQYFEE